MPDRMAPSVRKGMPLRERLADDARLLRSYLGRRARDFGPMLAELDEWAGIVEARTGRPLAGRRAFEIGYGTQPYRMLALLAQGVDAWGVDAEVPALSGSAGELRRMLRANGFERAAKTVARHLLFDRRERAAFRAAIGAAGDPYSVDPSRFLIGDAADCSPPGRFDLIYSVNVFEHVERASLERLVPRMRDWLTPDGIALIRPDIWTGLSGSHLPEWRSQGWFDDRPRRSEPWEHLRRRRFEANTSLNELTRDDYRELFRASFEILEERDAPRTGQDRLLTAQLREELSAWSEEDLLDSHPTFVLAPR